VLRLSETSQFWKSCRLGLQPSMACSARTEMLRGIISQFLRVVAALRIDESRPSGTFRREHVHDLRNLLIDAFLLLLIRRVWALQTCVSNQMTSVAPSASTIVERARQRRLESTYRVFVSRIANARILGSFKFDKIQKLRI
jgi:hypothetical protein